MMNNDPYDTGTPKYSTAQDIYDALYVVESGEEIGILSEMFSDVSWENQDYYYTDNGGKLAERWNEIIDYGNKMWIMDVAVFQLEDEDANEWMYQILCNDDLAKRIGFKKIFVNIVLRGASRLYNETAEAFLEELQDLDRFDYLSNSRALLTVLEERGYTPFNNPYSELCSAVYNKLKGLQLDKERQLIVESRALLTAYDDFMFGLKANQYLYNQQEQQFRIKQARLQEAFDEKVKQLLAIAQSKGLLDEFITEMPLLESDRRGTEDMNL